MQQIQKKIGEKFFLGVTGTTWIAGLLIAGSDSPYMPWVNGIGLILFFCASLLLGKIVHPVQSNSEHLKSPGFYKKPVVRERVLKKHKQRLKTRYAMES